MDVDHAAPSFHYIHGERVRKYERVSHLNANINCDVYRFVLGRSLRLPICTVVPHASSCIQLDLNPGNDIT